MMLQAVWLALFWCLACFPTRSRGYLGYGTNRVPLWPPEGLRSAVEIALPFPTTYSPTNSVVTPKNRGVEVADDLKSVLTSPLPWAVSVNPAKDLSYMRFLTYQLSVMEKLGMREQNLDESIAVKTSSVKPARIGNLCFSGGKFRKVRMTYFDAGNAVQVFNTLWYPRYEYDMPLLGMDLISLGKHRVLNVIDFQPLYPTPEYSAKYIQQLSTTRSKYPDLHGQLSGKIYDDTSFFSNNMLFGRFTDESKLSSVVFPAYQDYLEQYLEVADSAVPNPSPAAMAEVQRRQAAYDSYSALKDPAVGLFDAYFGKEWSKRFVHDFLFTLSSDKSLAQQNVHSFHVDSSSGSIIVGQTSHSSSSPTPLNYDR